MKNPYLPIPVVIKSARRETPGVKTFILQKRDRKPFNFEPGQIIAASLPGFGEAFFAPSTADAGRRTFEISVQRIGRVTSQLHNLKAADQFGLRGPFGQGFDLKKITGQPLLLIAGGIGIIPIRSLLRHLTDNFCLRYPPKIQLFYGARTYQDLLFKKEFNQWKKCLDLEVTLSKPYPDTDRGWRSHAGLLSTVFKKTPPLTGGLAILCGPPIMFKVMVPKLLQIGFFESAIYLSIERRMQCAGLTTCQHCGVGEHYVCQDGPVFNYAEMKDQPQFDA